MISANLYAFLSDWLAWTKAGAPEQYFRLPWRRNWPYRRGYGLCVGAQQYGDRALRLELAKEFVKDKMSTSYPFGEARYKVYQKANNLHLDPNSLAWVQAKLAEYEDTY